MASVDIALIHHPVLNKIGENIGSSVTNLDIHDIARAATTYGVNHYYIVTPYSDQQDLVTEIMQHWQEGHGATANPARKKAFSCVRLMDSLDSLLTKATKTWKKRPLIIMTSAVDHKQTEGYADIRKRISNQEPIILLFGTASGLAPEIQDMADYALPPIDCNTGYNHLSVRSAVSITLDRLLSKDR